MRIRDLRWAGPAGALSRRLRAKLLALRSPQPGCAAAWLGVSTPWFQVSDITERESVPAIPECTTEPKVPLSIKEIVLEYPTEKQLLPTVNSITLALGQKG